MEVINTAMVTEVEMMELTDTSKVTVVRMLWLLAVAAVCAGGSRLKEVTDEGDRGDGADT